MHTKLAPIAAAMLLALTTPAHAAQQTPPRVALVEGQLYTEPAEIPIHTDEPAGTTYELASQAEEPGEPLAARVDGTTIKAYLRYINCPQIQAGQLYKTPCTMLQPGHNSRDITLRANRPDGTGTLINYTVTLIPDERLLYEPAYEPQRLAPGEPLRATPNNRRPGTPLPTNGATYSLLTRPAGWQTAIDPNTGEVTGTAPNSPGTRALARVRTTFNDGTHRDSTLELHTTGTADTAGRTDDADATAGTEAAGSSRTQKIAAVIGSLAAIIAVLAGALSLQYHR